MAHVTEQEGGMGPQKEADRHLWSPSDRPERPYEEDPRHLAGRLEEYHATKDTEGPEFAVYIKQQAREHLHEACSLMTGEKHFFRYMAWLAFEHLNPRWNKQRYDASLEALFREEPSLTPIAATAKLMGIRRMKPWQRGFLRDQARRVKHRLRQQKKQEEGA